MVYLLSILVISLFVQMVAPVVTQQFGSLWENREALLGRTQELAEQGLGWYRANFPEQLQAQIDTSLEQAGAAIAGAVQNGAMRTLGIVTNTVSFLLGMIVIPFWLFYVLADQPRFMLAIRRRLPASVAPDVLNIFRIVDAIMGAYIRGQLILCVVIGLAAAIGLTLLGVQFAAVLGVFAGMLEFIPFLGPILGAIPAVMVATIQSPTLGLYTLILFIAIQQVENVFLVPRISGQAVELHPAIIMVVLVLANELAGLWGMLVAVPFTAILRDVFRYAYLRLGEEPPSPEAAMALVRGPRRPKVAIPRPE